MTIRYARFGSRQLAMLTAAAFLLLFGCKSASPGSGKIDIAFVAVRIAILGEGGLVRSADPAFECSAAACTQQVVRGSLLHLEAVPELHATFQGWGGACTGPSACEVLADRDLDVTAAFSKGPAAVLSVAVQVEGEGDVRSTPAGLDCGQTCSATFAAGVVVSLAPSAHPGSLFAGWSGACAGLGACQVGPAEAASLSAAVHAAFVKLPPGRHGLTVGVVGNGAVRSVPDGIDCGATCSASFDSGTAFQLTALPGEGARFVGWAGACSGTGGCTLTLSADAQVSAAFEPLPPARATLSVGVTGDGAGRVTSDPAGIDCRWPSSGTCSASFASGSVVQIIPAANPGSVFAGWAGACSGSASCSVTLDRDLTVSAAFAKTPLPTALLSIIRTGSGTGGVVSSPAGIDCGGTCSATFASGAVVTLAQTPAAGSNFAGWSGACSGTGGCTLTLSADAQVSAAFEAVPPARAKLSAALTGDGAGRVTSEPAGIDCRRPSSGACSASFASGSVVQLVPAADPGSVFGGWAGACSGSASCSVTLDRDLTVSAAFAKTPPTTALLSIVRTGNGTGRVASSPAGIACGDACSATFATGTVIALSQAPAAGSRFAGWSGACSGSGTCVVTLAAPAEVVAEFDAVPPAGISIEVTLTDPSHNLLAVAPGGTAYGTSHGDDSAAVYASTDNARTWSRRGRASARVVRMTALSDGVLLADVETGGSASIERSGDGGATWTQVLTLGQSRTLSPHSFDEGNGRVYLAEYQTAASPPIHLWSSADRGRSWTVVYTFSGYRHAHAVRVEPGSGAIWIFMGDGDPSALLRSTDGGSTWKTMLAGESQARVVDAVFTPAGLLYGLDISPPLAPGILRLAPNGMVTRLANLPGPSYSMHAMRAGGFLAGTTREPRDIYPPPGEENTYIFGSADGDTWSEVARFPRIDTGEYANADVYWELPSGEAVIHLYNVEPMGYGEGYLLATVKVSR